MPSFHGVHYARAKKGQLPERWAQLLPPGTEIAIVGAGDHLEIWPRELWEQQLRETPDELLADRLA